jgi:hypothetical protein
MATATKVTKASAEGDAVQKALLDQHTANMTPGPKVPMPNGARVSATPYIGMRYQGMDATQMLGDPASILKDPRPGWKYVWKKRTDRQTMAWERAGILVPITPDEVDETNPMAEYVADVTTTGTYVTWESLSLFAMSPKWVKKIYQANEDWAISRLAAQSAQIKGDIEQQTEGAYTGKFEVKAR